MGKIIDLIGQRFERLTVVNFVELSNQGAKWECVCDCGNIKVILGKQLRRKSIKSCGCYKIDILIERSTTHGQQRKGHKSPEHRAWRHMKSRCLNNNVYNYYNYGGRGVSVCDRWLNSFENFFIDMGVRPSNEHSLDRIDSNGNYEPSNCRWATTREQSRNLRTNHWIEYNNQKLILSDWALELKTTPSNLSRMLNKKSFKDTYNFYINK